MPKRTDEEKERFRRERYARASGKPASTPVSTPASTPESTPFPDTDPDNLPPYHGLKGDEAAPEEVEVPPATTPGGVGLGNCQSGYLASGVWGSTCQYLLTPYDLQATWDPTYPSPCNEYGYCQAYCQQGCVHCAIDVSMPYGTALYAIADATVKIAGNTGYYTPLELLIQLPNGTQFIYGHCSQLNVSVGQAVKQGQLVAWSGYNASNHLHFEERRPSSACTSGYTTVDPTQDAINYTGGTTPTAAFGVNDRVQVVSGPANFRTGPGTTYPIVEVIQNGGLLCVTSGPTVGGSYTWYGATYQADGKAGYLVRDVLALDAAGACGTKLKTTAGSVNVRTGPGTTYAIVGTIATAGTVVTWDGQQQVGGSYTWDHCTTPVGTGWIANLYLAPVTTTAGTMKTTDVFFAGPRLPATAFKTWVANHGGLGPYAAWVDEMVRVAALLGMDDAIPAFQAAWETGDSNGNPFKSPYWTQNGNSGAIGITDTGVPSPFSVPNNGAMSAHIHLANLWILVGKGYANLPSVLQDVKQVAGVDSYFQKVQAAAADPNRPKVNDLADLCLPYTDSHGVSQCTYACDSNYAIGICGRANNSGVGTPSQ